MNTDDTRMPAFARQVAAPPQRQALTLPGGYETSVYIHSPRGSARPVPVVYLHGIQSHPGWFVGSAAYLAAQGYCVWQVTRRGSGLNRSGRGHAASAAQLLDDLDAACRAAMSQSGASRVHLLGVSWGGKLAACYATDAARAAKLASLTLVAPGIAPRVDVGLATKFSIGLALLVSPHKKFDIPLSAVELFTDNPAMREYLMGDENRLHRATARFLYASRQFDRIVKRGQLAGDVPLTLISSSRDRIIDSERCRQAVERMTAGRAETTVLEGAHTLEFEPNPQPLYEALAAALARGD